ncbi:MAG: sigma-70 family RNA polymerase sigma factor [Longicatena sp.]|jgi:RNA polymerase sporulation-specific sigma factor|uniref:sigma-70 family RNA polymerase sigma factor n=1 Tax=Anaerorhabdus sp. TaxID=1872524 RepID=UPI002FC62472
MWQTYPDDFELLYYCRQHDDWAFEMMLRKYEAFSRKIVKECIDTNSGLNIFKDDFLIETWLMLVEAIALYREKDKCSFGTFYYKCAISKVKSLVRHHLREKNLSNINALSLDTIVGDDSEKGYVLQVASANSCSNPIYALEYKETCLRVKETLSNLKPQDKQVLGLYLDGYSYNNASRILGCDEKAIDNRLQKVKKAIKLCIYETDK